MAEEGQLGIAEELHAELIDCLVKTADVHPDVLKAIDIVDQHDTWIADELRYAFGIKVKE
jgi:hypothetical protein